MRFSIATEMVLELASQFRTLAYEYYAPGFRAGWEGRVRYGGRTFEQAESELQADYNGAKTELDPIWQDVRPAARTAWERVDRNWKS